MSLFAAWAFPLFFTFVFHNMDAFLGEIRTFSFSFAPKYWAQCNGQLLPVNQNQALFSLLGTTYGGNGTTTFGLPNLKGRVPLGMDAPSGGNYNRGTAGGSPMALISTAQTPAHTHLANVSLAANSTNAPAGNLLPGAFPSLAGYTADGSQLAALNPATVENAGGGLAHENRQPSMVLNICIALAGIFPSRP